MTWNWTQHNGKNTPPDITGPVMIRFIGERHDDAVSEGYVTIDVAKVLSWYNIAEYMEMSDPMSYKIRTGENSHIVMYS